MNLAHLVEECERLVELKARNKDITVVSESEPDLPLLWVDARAVRQVVLNLLSNGVKFTQPGGRIDIRVGWTSGGGQYVSVADNGPGIPEEEIPIVLSAFGQGSIAIGGAEDGTGLGLPIVQALMHTHDGDFKLSSKLREGTTATAIFPRFRVMEVCRRSMIPSAVPDRYPRQSWTVTSPTPSGQCSSARINALKCSLRSVG